MSILDDDNGIENQLIDPFARSTISNEAYPFPVEQYTGEQPVEEEPIAVNETPTLVSGGASIGLNPSSSLDVVGEQPVEDVSDITDTPQAPINDGGEHVSFEFDEQPQSYHELDELIDVHNRLKEIGGISQNDVIQVESISPGLLKSVRPLNMYSAIPTPIGLEVSLESIGKEINKAIKQIIQTLIGYVKRFVAWIVRHLIEGRKTDDLNAIKNRWSSVEKLAARKDSTVGMTAFRKLYGDTDAGRKASTNSHFAQLYAESQLKELSESKVTLGVQLVSNNKLFTEISEHVRSIDSLRKDIGDALVSLEGKGRSSLNSKVSESTYSEMMSRIKTRYAERGKLMTTNINNALNVKDAIGHNKPMIKELSDYTKTIERNITQLEKIVDSSTVDFKDMKEGVVEVRNAFVALIKSAAVLDLYLSYYSEYYNILTTVINRTERKIAAIV